MKLLFIAAVTAYLVGRVFAEAATGPAGLLEAAVYGLTAGFGLEFLAASWPSLWSRSGPRVR